MEHTLDPAVRAEVISLLSAKAWRLIDAEFTGKRMEFGRRVAFDMIKSDYHILDAVLCIAAAGLDETSCHDDAMSKPTFYEWNELLARALGSNLLSISNHILKESK